jgi:hypothetical protein
MGLFYQSNKNGQREKPDLENNHCVIIRFNYGLEEMDELYKLDREIDRVLVENNAGDCDGHEVAMDNSDGFLFLYGNNAETVFKTVLPILKKCPFMKGAVANLRFGPPKEGTLDIDVEI